MNLVRNLSENLGDLAPGEDDPQTADDKLAVPYGMFKEFSQIIKDQKPYATLLREIQKKAKPPYN